MSSTSQIVQKLWNQCNVLHDDLSACDAQSDGVSYLLARHAHASGDYFSAKLRAGVEQLPTAFQCPLQEIDEDHP